MTTPIPADRSAPLLVLAPHLVYPTRNGSDISLDRIARELSAFAPFVDLVAEREVVRFEGGAEVRRTAFENALRSRVAAAAWTVVRQSHVFLEKFVTPAYRAAAEPFLRDAAYGTVLCSYLTTAGFALGTDGRPPGRRHLVWTHNDEFKWFEEMRRASRNPLVGLAAATSERWLHRFFRRHQRDVLCLHVTEEDRAGFARYYPDHPSRVVPIGVDLPGVTAPPRAPQTEAEPEAIRLLFVGSLGMKMNLDALRHFAAVYEPPLRAAFGEGLAMRVAGSRPSDEVAALCRERGWALHPDVSDEALDALFAETTFSVLPFDYATGAKLKLLHSLAHAVPFLATEKVGAQADAVVHPSLMADAPEAWVERVAAVRAGGIDAAAREALRAVALRHSWAASAERIAGVLA